MKGAILPWGSVRHSQISKGCGVDQMVSTIPDPLLITLDGLDSNEEVV